MHSREHHIRAGRPATLTESQLRGWRAFELTVEAPPAPSTQAKAGA